MLPMLLSLGFLGIVGQQSKFVSQNQSGCLVFAHCSCLFWGEGLIRKSKDGHTEWSNGFFYGMFGLILQGRDYCIGKGLKTDRGGGSLKGGWNALPLFESPLARDLVDFLVKHGGERLRDSHAPILSGRGDFPD